MHWRDGLQLAAGSLLRQRLRTGMLLLAMAIGVAAVTLLTAVGQGARGYVENEFAVLGKDTIIVFPGRKETTGGMPPLTGGTARDITLDDARYLQAHIAGIDAVAPIVIGSASARHGNRHQDATVLGSSHAFFSIHQLKTASGSPLPPGDFTQATAHAVIGSELRAKLFGERSAIGEILRLDDRRFVIVGELLGTGDAFGLDLSKGVIIPVASAQSLFNVENLFRVLIRIRPGAGRAEVSSAVFDLMTKRHHGKPDITLVTPDAMLQTLDELIGMLTLGVAAIAAISLLVAGILIMNVALINVRQRTKEIGLLKALGASSRQVQTLFLMEALLVACLGALTGLLLGEALVQLGLRLWPDIPFATPAWALLAAPGIALVCGLAFSLWPARLAGQLQPVDALRSLA